LQDRELIKKLEKAAMEIRISLLELASLQVIHIGGDLSIADVMTALWQYQLKYDPQNPLWENRDRFILSKGHASAVTSFNQAAIGCYRKGEVINEYATDFGRFSMHSCNLVNPYVDISTGSLGHGFPISLGLAAALRLKGNFDSRVYVIMGDAEQSEGSIWEAAMNAVHHKLGNIVGFIDYNGLGGDNKIIESTSLGNIGDKYRTFGWRVEEINGNNMEDIVSGLNSLDSADSEVPTIFICHTVKGKGVPFMENQVKWHCGKITIEEMNESVARLKKEFQEKWGEE